MQMANNPTSGTAPRPKWHRAILWAGGFATCAVIALASLAAWYLHRAEPILREALIAPQVDSSTKIKVVTAWYGGKCPPQD